MPEHRGPSLKDIQVKQALAPSAVGDGILDKEKAVPIPPSRPAVVSDAVRQVTQQTANLLRPGMK